MPRSAPTRTGSTSARAAASAWASARAGMRWPPVPPPASKTLIGAPNAEFGMRNAECHDKCRAPRPSTSIPHSAFRTPHLGDPPPSSDADQDPRGHQRHEQARAAVRDERERDAGGRQERESHRTLERGRDADQCGEAHGEQLAERVARGSRDAEADPHEAAEQHEDREHAEEAPLLADGRKDEVRVCVGQVAELLLALSQPDPEEPAGPDADRSEEHTSELQSPCNLVCRLLLEKKNSRASRR